MDRLSSFSDDVILDINSPVEINYDVITIEKDEKCNSTAQLWPSIVIAVIGAIMVVYTAVAPNIFDDRRILGVIFLSLWTAMWALILWVISMGCDMMAVWWILIIPVAVMILFFVVIIVMNVGVPEV